MVFKMQDLKIFSANMTLFSKQASWST